MRYYADLHVHSKYSRACSRYSELPELARWARRKGITVLGTGDFTHPEWARRLREDLVPAEPGLFRLRDDLEEEVLRSLPRSCRGPLRFLLQVEVATGHRQGGRARKLHHLLYVPDFEAAAGLSRRLARHGDLTGDGRPFLAMDARELLSATLESGEGAYLVPAHIWTPWFGVLGSTFGFDSVEECYGDLAGEIFAVETGLSSDPEMNWRVPGLDRYRLVSHSDAHSAPIIGRNATLFDTRLDYFALRHALRTGEGYTGTVDLHPEEGKYHLDGHRACGVRLDPDETEALGGRCPECGRRVTVGVLHRVRQLTGHPEGTRPATAGASRKIVPLPELVGELLGVGPKSKKVTARVAELTSALGPELPLLLDLPLPELRAAGEAGLAEAVDRLRTGRVHRDPGYDGVFGTVSVFAPGETPAPAPDHQPALF
ncbi:endonuclease Q family protein [Streptomyces sp. LP05-1]|uniref:Endonuclease Q family protein n=1 Tax=Streptomyces pyxinae TaxID=2970734 RepID=A0ABT2CG04_9ACTN|nr:endonuclease Q family protein [Streptomyces sp. LP05-1]MCS0635554.1 endonuclease Q family protein [Streptomyces sp. LP05-1]